MTISPTVYLAGPIMGLTVGEASDWRYQFALRLANRGILALDPMRAKPWLKGKGRVADQYPEHVLGSAEGIMARDMMDVRRCDLIFANLLCAERVSIGTVMEIAVAWQLQKPIVIAEQAGGLHNHGMLLRGTNAIVVPDLNVAYATIAGMLLP